MRTRIAAIVLLAGVLLSGCGDEGAATECTTNADCGGGECHAGACADADVADTGATDTGNGEDAVDTNEADQADTSEADQADTSDPDVAQAPPGTCAEPVTLEGASGSYSATVEPTGAFANGICDGAERGAGELVLRFDAVAEQSFTFAATSAAPDISISVVAECAETADCLAGQDTGGTVAFKASQDGTYYVVVDTAAAGDVQLTWISALPCSLADCSGHGTCVNDDGAATCVCDAGYTNGASPTECVDVCDAVDCSGHGTCSNATGDAVCACDTGYAVSAEGAQCVSVCDGIACSGHGTCEATTGAAVCACDAGYVVGPDATTCLSVCEGVDCRGHGTCDNATGAALCTCDSGFTVGSTPTECWGVPDIEVRLEDGTVVASGSGGLSVPNTAVSATNTVAVVVHNTGNDELVLSAEAQTVDALGEGLLLASRDNIVVRDGALTLDADATDLLGGLVYDGLETTNLEFHSYSTNYILGTGDFYAIGAAGSCTNQLFHTQTLRQMGATLPIRLRAQVYRLAGSWNDYGYVGFSSGARTCWPTIDVGIYARDNASTNVESAEFWVNGNSQCDVYPFVSSEWQDIEIVIPPDTLKPALYIDGVLACQSSEEVVDGFLDKQMFFASHRGLSRSVDTLRLEQLTGQLVPTGSATSVDVLAGRQAGALTSFAYQATYPASTTLKVRFSQDGVTWVDAAGTVDAWESIVRYGAGAIDLTPLGWTGGSFYYQVEMTASGAAAASSTLSAVTLSYEAPVVVDGSLVFDATVPSSLVQAGESVPLTLAFRPTSTGSATGTVTLVSNDPDESPYTFTVSSTGL